MKRINEIFDIKNSQSLELINCQQVEDGICFVSRTEKNNGIAARIERLDGLEPMPAGAITVALSGSVLSSFYQDEPFYTAFHIACLYPKQHLTKEQMLCYAYIIEQNKYRYNYGRQANKTLKNILVPDVSELDAHINNISINNYKFDKKPINQALKFDTENWGKLKISDIFDMKQGKTLSIENKNRYTGNIPCINGSSVNNGILCFLSEDIQNIGFELQKAPCLSLSRVGNSGLTFFQNQDFFIADNAFSLKLKNGISSKYVFLFLSTILDQEIPKYNYGRIVGKNKYLNKEIKLPVTKDGQPDWQFMENYIKSLNYSKSL